MYLPVMMLICSLYYPKTIISSLFVVVITIVITFFFSYLFENKKGYFSLLVDIFLLKFQVYINHKICNFSSSSMKLFLSFKAMCFFVFELK